MGSFKLAGMTISSIFKKPITSQYPYEQRADIPGAKGHISNDVEACILCGMCQKACPCHCIKVDKASRRWEINPFMCILCRSCVRACPTKCLTMEESSTPIATAKYCTDLSVPEKEKTSSKKVADKA